MQLKKTCLDVAGGSALATVVFVGFFGTHMTPFDMLGTFCICVIGMIPVYLALLGQRPKS